MTIHQALLTRGVLASTFAQWNPLDKSPLITLAQNDLRATCDSAFQGPAVRANKGKSVGKWYWEITCVAAASSTEIGVSATTEGLTLGVGSTANGYSFAASGTKHNNGSSIAYPGGAGGYTTGNVISVLLDMDGKTITFWKGGVSQTTAFTGLTGTLFPAVAPSANGILLANFGAATFAFTPPVGYAGVS